MALPDRIERSVEIAHPPATVWAALTPPEDGSRLVRRQGHDRPASRRGRANDVQERRHGRHAGGTGRGAGGVRVHLATSGPNRTRSAPNLCRVTLEAVGVGTRLRAVETGFAQLPVDSRRKTYDSHAEGRASELGELADYLDA